MLKLAVKAELPLVAVFTRDTMNLPEVLFEITKKQPVQFLPNAPVTDGQLYTLHSVKGVAMPPLFKVYQDMVKHGSTLLIVNPTEVVEPMFDAGEVPVPRPLVMNFMKEVVDNDKKAEELLRGLGGCTIKEAAELCRLTMARDTSLTVQGLMETRKSSFQAATGLTQVNSKQGFYEAPQALQSWVKKERSCFLTGRDRLRSTRR